MPHTSTPGSKVRARLYAAPGSALVADAPKETAIAKATRQVQAARLAGKDPDSRDLALLRDARLAHDARQAVLDAQAKADAARRKSARDARHTAKVHDVLPAFACSPVAHCSSQAYLAQCKQFVNVMKRYNYFINPCAT